MHPTLESAGIRPASVPRGRRRTALVPLALILLLAASCITAGQAFLLGNGVPRVISDGYGYWSYLPSYLILDDPTFARFMERYHDTPLAQGMLRHPEGGYFQKYQVGVAVLQAPFFLAADAYARGRDYPRDGYSPPYQAAAAVGAGVYALLGLAALMAAYRPWYPAWSLALAGGFAFLGTNAYHYATFDGSFSHVCTFFLASVLLLVLMRGREGAPWRGMAMGGVLGMMVLVRPVNALYLLLVAFRPGTGRWRKGLPGGLAETVVCGVTACLFFLAQMAVWRASTGKWLFYPYVGEYFDFASPHVMDVLFSVRKGLFFWNPMYLAALAGLVLVRKPRGYLAAAALFLVVHLYVVSSWYCWWYGGTLGQRAYVDVLPVLFPGLAGLTVLRPRALGLFATALCSLLLLYSLFCTWFYWIGVIPPDGAGLEHLHLAWRHLSGFVLGGMWR